MAAADLVRQGAVLADIGTDHALLPVFLCREGKIKRAIASDIGEGPLSAAKRQVEAAGLSDRILLHLGNGLDGLADEGLTDIAICGMGGELIVDILRRAPFVKDRRIRLVLQPMTHAEILREYLVKTGFSIIDEDVVTEQNDRKIYQIICAEYSGETVEYTADELYLGRNNIQRRSAEFIKLCERLRKTNLEIKKAKESAGQIADTEDGIVKMIDKYLH